MAVDAFDRPNDPRFIERVLQRVEVVERERRRQERLRYLLPIATILVIGVAWAIALSMGALVVRHLIEVTAWLRVVARVEEHLSGALLGPLGPLPSIVSLLLLVAAIAWVRMHQPGPREWGP